MRRNLFLTSLLFCTCFATRASAQGTLPLERVADVLLPGGVSRFDYQSLDSESGRLYIAHLGDNRLIVFDTRKRRARTAFFSPELGQFYVAVPHRTNPMAEILVYQIVP
jgi:hypothetical protein